MMRAPRTTKQSRLVIKGKTTLKFVKFVTTIQNRMILDTKIFFSMLTHRDFFH